MTTALANTAATTAEATMNRAYDLLEQADAAPDLGPLRQPLADLLAFHAAVPAVEHAGHRYLVGYPYADRDGEQWEILNTGTHDGRPLAILLPAGAGEPATLDEIVDEYGPLRRIAHPGTSLPTPEEALPYWGSTRWEGPVARCSSMKHLAPVGDDGLLDTHSISAGFTGRCPGSNTPPRTAPWPK
ncbi:phiSA1p31-related protein [Streptomyces sp. H27-C3]|uniref:phiSA1p31-related protein n=1 Tax=Streptomyces sp. H27-C3 TaxID=3046305 RepID=UPI0024B996B1|nr:phiSA1p31-related protein [Streptomyces sp. H27-C3]MDJ0466128.1 phiSA1p31-related protein [Streptomyces sp. H27-C3]